MTKKDAAGYLLVVVLGAALLLSVAWGWVSTDNCADPERIGYCEEAR